MAEDNYRLIHQCELEYFDTTKTPKQSKTGVEMLSQEGRSKLQLVLPRTGNVFLQINTDDIGAAVIVNLHKKNHKAKRPRQCLLLLWLEDGKWRHLVLVDKEKPAPLNCVQQVKSNLLKICPLNCFQLSNNSVYFQDHAGTELQFWKNYIAIMPVDGVRDVDAGDILEYTSSLSSEFIFRKFTPELTLVEDGGDDSLSPNSVSLKMSDNRTVSYTVSSELIKNGICEQFALKSPKVDVPLPPVPPDDDPMGSPITDDCSNPPPIEEAPFWFYQSNDVETIYDHIDPEYKSFVDLYNKKYKERQRPIRREPSQRFKNFVDSVHIKPGMLELGEPAPSRVVYDLPRVSVCFADEEPDLTETEFPEDNVESTFAEFLSKIVQYTYQPETKPVCRFGMTRREREMFCFRLDLNEFDIVLGESWKTFADKVMVLDGDDIRMIDEFSSKYKCQVVEVVLDHWHKLHVMVSDKCKYPAVKQSIREVLQDMERFSLLDVLRWQSS